MTHGICVGVLEIESFYPARERFELAMTLNNLLASPSFGAWLEGEPLDVDKMLFDPTGRPRIAICSIAHLGERERTFFVSLLLNQLLGWVRLQRGTSELRALVYMDEIFGFLPPVASAPRRRTWRSGRWLSSGGEGGPASRSHAQAPGRRGERVPARGPEFAYRRGGRTACRFRDRPLRS